MKFLFLILFTSIGVFTQTKVTVKDSITGKPISYVGVWANQDGNAYSTNQKGKFTLNNTYDNSVLYFFTSGYKKKTIQFKDLKKVVYLVPEKSNNLKCISENSKIKLILNDSLSPSPPKMKTLGFSTTALIASYIPYSEDFNTTKFLNKFRLGTMVFSKKCIYKLRFFEVGDKGEPKQEITKQDIICTSTSNKTNQIENDKNVFNLSENKSVKNLVDLSKYKMEFPKTGLFLAIEIMNLEENLTQIGNYSVLSPNLIISKNKKNVWKYESGIWVKVEKYNGFTIELSLSN